MPRETFLIRLKASQLGDMNDRRRRKKQEMSKLGEYDNRLMTARPKYKARRQQSSESQDQHQTSPMPCSRCGSKKGTVAARSSVSKPASEGRGYAYGDQKKTKDRSSFRKPSDANEHSPSITLARWVNERGRCCTAQLCRCRCQCRCRCRKGALRSLGVACECIYSRVFAE